MPHRIKIRLDHLGRSVVLVDDKPMDARAIQINARVREIPTVTLELLAEDVEFESDANLVPAGCEKIAADVQRLDLKPGDRMVLSTPAHVSQEIAMRLEKTFREIAPGIGCFCFPAACNCESSAKGKTRDSATK